MNVWIFQTGEPLPIDGPAVRGMRAMNLASALNRRGHAVTLWSTDFYHQEKRHRYRKDMEIKVADGLEVRLITSRGYGRNIGPARFIDHAQLGYRLAVALQTEAPPNVAFVGFPPIEFAASAIAHCRRHAIPSLLDIKDLWPDLFEDAFPGPARWLARIALSPLHSMTNRAVRQARGLCAPTEAYLSWALRRAQRELSDSDCIAPILQPSHAVDEDLLRAAGCRWDDLGVPADGRLRACFVGNLGRTTDFTPILRAVRCNPMLRRWQFVIAGNGDQESRWHEEARGLNNVVFPGRIDLASMRSLFSRSTIALAPFRRIQNYERNVPNKIHDYLSAGLAVMTPLSGPTRALLDSLGLGGGYREHDSESFAAALLGCEDMLVPSDAIRSAHESRFDAHVVYSRLVDHLEDLSQRACSQRNAPLT